ncbi:hypothetical protein SHIRM173S_01099 [Streptomyces hirsutus]
MRTSVSSSAVFTAHTGPPTSYALLNIAWDAGRVDPPSGSGQAGRSTRVSRGMLTTVAAVRPASRWTTMAVSERAPPLSPPPSARFSPPLRESEPSTRMLKDPVGRGEAEADAEAPRSEAVPLAGRSSPRALSMSTLVILAPSCQYAQPAAPAPSTSAPARARPAISAPAPGGPGAATSPTCRSPGSAAYQVLRPALRPASSPALSPALRPVLCPALRPALSPVLRPVPYPVVCPRLRTSPKTRRAPAPLCPSPWPASGPCAPSQTGT